MKGRLNTKGLKYAAIASAALAALIAGCGGGDDNASGSGAQPGTVTPSSLPWMDKSLPPEQRAQLLVSAMTLQQKEQQLVGNTPGIVPELPNCYGARHVSGIPALAIPTLRVTNGPVGIGQNDCVDASLANNTANATAAYTHSSSAKATALPSAIAMAASFDPQVATDFGDVIGTEGNNLALHVFEAPGVNLARTPGLGRNFEYFGEDPYLTGVMAVAEINAVQGRGLIAMAKHFAANEQETNRMSMNTVVDDQVLHELYLLPFEMAVKDGNVASVMCSYNSLNGAQACENKHLLTDILRGQWGFKGYVQSDFFAVKSTVPPLLAGLDHLMPTPAQWSPALLDAALAAGSIKTSDIDTALKRRYAQMFRLGIFDRKLVQTPIDYAAGGAKAKSIGARSTVLLQNNNQTLPFAASVANVVLVGKATQVYAQQAVAGGVMVGKPMGGGGGSSDVVPNYTVAPVDGIKNVLKTLGNSGATVKLVLIDDANQTATIDGTATTYASALSAAAAADAVVVMAGTIAEEGADRASYADSTGTTLAKLGNDLDWYVAKPNTLSTAAANQAGNSNTAAMITDLLATASTTPKAMAAKTALVLKDNASVPLDPLWVGASGPAILEAWFPGQEDGDIVAEALFGVTNPSGKLPVTFPLKGQSFMDSITASQFPGVMNNGVPTVTYSEGLNIGYRWYDANSVAPAFPFGHGLSYTTFALTSPNVSSAGAKYSVSVNVKNTGSMRGSEVVQVYLSVPVAGQPPKRLVGFQKVDLAPGAAQNVTVTIDPAGSSHPLSVWDKTAQSFVIPSGNFTAYVGNSSGNLQVAGSFSR
nr:glycoside hydrolase family 3 N-terminal domain-containing protein [uncultured Cupriavidus sp.]